MGNGVNLPSVFTPPQGPGPPPLPHNLPCYDAVKTICTSHLTNKSDCEDCRFTVPGAWGKLRAACGKTPIATLHASCSSFFPTPPVLDHTGIGQKNVYASEFGTTGSSSFESMAPTLSPQHWGLHAGMAPDTCQNDTKPNVRCVGEHVCTGNNPMAQRNYACAGPIRLFFGNKTTVDIAATGEAAFKGQLYQCQLVQAVVLKQIYEARRTQNAFGHLVWMLNEVSEKKLSCAPSESDLMSRSNSAKLCVADLADSRLGKFGVRTSPWVHGRASPRRPMEAAALLLQAIPHAGRDGHVR